MFEKNKYFLYVYTIYIYILSIWILGSIQAVEEVELNLFLSKNLSNVTTSWSPKFSANWLSSYPINFLFPVVSFTLFFFSFSLKCYPFKLFLHCKEYLWDNEKEVDVDLFELAPHACMYWSVILLWWLLLISRHIHFGLIYQFQ